MLRNPYFLIFLIPFIFLALLCVRLAYGAEAPDIVYSAGYEKQELDLHQRIVCGDEDNRYLGYSAAYAIAKDARKFQEFKDEGICMIFDGHVPVILTGFISPDGLVGEAIVSDVFGYIVLQAPDIS